MHMKEQHSLNLQLLKSKVECWIVSKNRVCLFFFFAGALFACLSFLENLTSNASAAVFNSVYAATVKWYSGFIFLLSGGLCVIPLAIVGYVHHVANCMWCSSNESCLRFCMFYYMLQAGLKLMHSKIPLRQTAKK